MAMFLPWQFDDARSLLGHTEQLPHALLIHGLAGMGKRQFALGLAATLLCEDRRQGLACGQCSACQWVAAGSHPDLMRVRPEAVAAAEGASVESDDSEPTASEGGAVGKKKLSEELKVEQIRALEPWYHRATHRGGWRIVVLYPADRLSVISANALLKALEEPPPNTLFFLTSDAPDRLLPTVLSRCQKFALTRPDPAQSVAWLAEQGLTEPEQWLAAAGGAPLAALAMRETLESPCPAWARSMIFDLSQGKMVDVAGMADQLAKGPATAWLSVLQRLAVDIGFACAGLQSRFYPGLESAFRQIGARASMQSANELSAWINQQNRLASHPLSPKLFAQVSLQHFCDAVL